MENLSKENQSSSSFALPPKKPDRLNFFLFLGLGLVILVLIGEGTYYLKLRKEKKQATSFSSPTRAPSQAEVFFPSPISHPTIALGAPVQKESLTKGEMIQLDYNVDDWAFSLSEGEPIYAAFSGRVELAGENDPQKLIVLRSEDDQLVWKYLFSGIPEIKNGDQVKKGDVLAKASRTPLPTRDVNLIIQALWQGKRVSVNKDFLNSFY